MNEEYDTWLGEIGIPRGTVNCFKRAGINTIGDLCSKTPEEVGHIRNLSRSQLELVLEKLKERGCILRKE